MKTTILRIAKCLALLLPVLALVLFFPFRNSNESQRIEAYYMEPKDSLDVVFLGASEIYSGYSSALAYEQCGYTSYPYAIPANHIALFESQLEEIYSTQSPQLVVVELNGALYTEDLPNADGTLRMYTDAMPFSRNKLRTVAALGREEEKLSYFVPFLMYHGTITGRQARETFQDLFTRWRRGYSLLKGSANTTEDTYTADGRRVLEDFSRQPLPEKNEAALRTFLEHCREKGYDNLLFVSFPHRIATDYGYTRFQMANRAGDIVREYGYDFVSMEYHTEKMGLDLRWDFFDDDHMNFYGQQKFTTYFGRYLLEEQGLVPRPQTVENQKNWQTCAEYNRLYYAYFDQLKTEHPGEIYWLWENARTVKILEELKEKG